MQFVCVYTIKILFAIFKMFLSAVLYMHYVGQPMQVTICIYLTSVAQRMAGIEHTSVMGDTNTQNNAAKALQISVHLLLGLTWQLYCTPPG